MVFRKETEVKIVLVKMLRSKKYNSDQNKRAVFTVFQTVDKLDRSCNFLCL